MTPPAGGSFQKGPDPTPASVQAARGPFRFTTKKVTGSGFAGGVLYTPSDAGTYGGILLVPPFMVNSSALAPFAERYASNGFVVLAMDARNTADVPAQRATQGKAAMQFLMQQDKVDRNRMAVGGYSMGGGATLEIARDTPTLKAAVPMVPWNTVKSFGSARVPTLILAAQGDTVASVAAHAQPFYNSLPASIPKGIAVAAGADHFVPTAPPGGHTQLAVAWMKYFVDGDARYRPFISRPSGMSTFELTGLK